MNQTSHEDPPSCRELHESVFDAIPSAIFVVNADLSIEDFNDAAIRLPEEVLSTTIAPDWSGDRIGDVLGCSNAHPGCGKSPLCDGCGLIECTRDSSRAQPVRKLLSITHLKNGQLVPLEYLVTAAPLVHGVDQLTLIILDSKENWYPLIVKANSATCG